MNMNKPSVDELKGIGLIITWKDLKANEEVEFIEAVGSKRGVAVFGEFGSGECKIEGSNDKQLVGILQESFGRNLNIKSPNEFIEINGLSRFIRPVVSGDEKTNLTVSIMVIL